MAKHTKRKGAPSRVPVDGQAYWHAHGFSAHHSRPCHARAFDRALTQLKVERVANRKPTWTSVTRDGSITDHFGVYGPRGRKLLGCITSPAYTPLCRCDWCGSLKPKKRLRQQCWETDRSIVPLKLLVLCMKCWMRSENIRRKEVRAEELRYLISKLTREISHVKNH